MSDAKVIFGLLGSRAPPHAGEEQTFSFVCPRRAGQRCAKGLIAGRIKLNHPNPDVDMWHWDGNAAAPTFTPSINCGGRGCTRDNRAPQCKSTSHQDVAATRR